MNKIYPIGFVALVVGLAIGSIFMVHTDNKTIDALREQHKKELKEIRDNESNKRDSLNIKLKELSFLAKQDSITIVALKDNIKADGVRVAKLKQQLNKLTPDEKINWLIDRYTPIPK